MAEGEDRQKGLKSEERSSSVKKKKGDRGLRWLLAKGNSRALRTEMLKMDLVQKNEAKRRKEFIRERKEKWKTKWAEKRNVQG